MTQDNCGIYDTTIGDDGTTSAAAVAAGDNTTTGDDGTTTGDYRVSTARTRTQAHTSAHTHTPARSYLDSFYAVLI